MKGRFFANLRSMFSTAIRKPLDGSSTLTRVRIWESGYFTGQGEFKKSNVGYAMLKTLTKREGNIGHVSVETKSFYASLWPEQLTIFNKYKIQAGESNQLSDDLHSEGRNPDHLLDFETLDLTGISKELEKFESASKYQLIGGNKVFHKDGAYNCSSFGYALLLAGGLKKYLPGSYFIQDYLIVTPNNLAEILIQAKKYEDKYLLQQFENDSNKGMHSK